METQSITEEINSSPIETSKHVTIITSSDKDAITKVDRQDTIKKRNHSCFEWIHLIAAIWIPIVIAIYAVVENNSNTSIATSDRLNDIEIANISRKSELEIAQGNRLSEIAIAEHSRQKDRDLAVDQQHQNILIEYQTFLAKLIIDNGVTLNKTPGAKMAAHFMTLTALDQLDTKRKSILIRSLYEAKLITLRRSTNLFDTSTINLEQVDLSNTIFGLLPNVPDTLPPYRYIRWEHLWLPHTILTNASFRHTALDCITFAGAAMDSADISFATHRNILCLNSIREAQTDFTSVSLVNASLYKVKFRFTSFNKANLTLANMQGFYCLECNFSSALLVHVDLSFSNIIHAYVLHKERLNFYGANLSQAVAHSAVYISINFDKSDWSNVQASQIEFYNCTFVNARMDNCSLVKSHLRGSVFRNASLYTIDLSYATLNNVSFANSDMRHVNLSYIKCDSCDFTNVTLHGGVLKNASLRNSNFLNSRVNAGQLEEAIDLSGSTLPNGTVVKSHD